MKGRLLTSSIVLALLASFVLVIPPHRVAAASATVADIANPDNYTCGQSGFITFERMPDLTNLSSGAINGVQFTTTNGFSWVVSDMATGNYNGKYPNGSYTAQGTHVAWLGPDQGAGRIDFVGGPASYFSLLTSNFSQVYLDAYKADGTLLATAGPASSNINTGHMAELKIVRDTADMAYVIVHDTGNFFIVDSICTNALNVPNQALHDYKQNRNADGTQVSWAPARLYKISTCDTMGESGCVITALTDVIKSYGLNTLPNGVSTDPGTLNDYLGLSSNQSTHTTCYILWENAGTALNFKIKDYRPRTTSYDDRIKRIDDALAVGNLAILGFPHAGGLHFVVLYQKAANAPDGSPDYYIADPYRDYPYATGDKTGKTLYQAYNKTLKQMASSFQVEVVENTAPQPGKSWNIVAHSPVEMLITDPDGLQSGFNFNTNSYELGIPDSSYGPGDNIANDESETVALPEILYFGQNGVKNGTYKIEVIGTGSGPYTLDIAIAYGPMNTSSKTIAGTAVAGVIDTYEVTVTDSGPVSVQLLAKVDIKPGEIPNPINIRSMGVIPLAILSTPTLNASTIDAQSVRFGPLGASAALYSMQDVNGDGVQDLVLQFRTKQTGIRVGDTQACISGKTTTDLNIYGCDQIRVTR